MKENTTIQPFSISASLKSYVNILCCYENRRNKSKKRMKK